MKSELSYRPLAADVIRRAIVRHDEDAAFARSIYDRFNAIQDRFGREGNEFQELRRHEEWLGLAQHAANESEFHLTRVVLAIADDVAERSFHDAERHLFPPSALNDGSRLFVAYPDDDGDFLKPYQSRGDGKVVMKLVVMDVARVVGIAR